MSVDTTELARLLAEFDPDLSIEIQAVLEGWAKQNEALEDHHGMNPRGSRPAADYRTLAAELERVRLSA